MALPVQISTVSRSHLTVPMQHYSRRVISPSIPAGHHPHSTGTSGPVGGGVPCTADQITCGGACCDARTSYCIQGHCRTLSGGDILLRHGDELCFKVDYGANGVDEFCASSIRGFR
jgi:hypothetical protein